MYNSISTDNYQRLTLESRFTRPFDYRLQQLNRKKRGEIFFLQALRIQTKSRIS